MLSNKRRYRTLTLLCLCAAVVLSTVERTAASDPDDLYWQPLKEGDPGLSGGEVLTLTIFNGELIVGGNFSLAGGNHCPGIARWDGSSWKSLGAGLIENSTVRALAVFDTLLVAAGHFLNAGGITGSDHVARWSGSTWLSPMEGGSGPVGAGDAMSLCVHRGGLICGGDVFLTVHPDWHGILHWNDTLANWLPLGGSTPGLQYVRALYNFGNELIAGGNFQQIGGTTVSNIARWDGTNWTPIGAGLPTTVYALTIFHDHIIAGGSFGVAKWDGVNWLPLGTFVNGTVLTFQGYNDELIAGGTFTESGGTAAANIARWNGSAWLPMGSGVYGNVSALAVYQGRLIVGGSFGTAGDKTVVNIATWYKPCCVATTGNVDCDGLDGVDISDLSALIDNLYISFAPLCCAEEANTDGQPGIDISDLSALIDYLYISFTPPAACQ